jgi:hypothetical protein
VAGSRRARVSRRGADEGGSGMTVKRKAGAMVVAALAVSLLWCVPAGAGTVRWSIAPTPSPTAYDQLLGVSCPTTTFCAAVGLSAESDGSYATLIESWDGADWTLMSGTNPTDKSELDGVSCTSPTNCVAVGLSVGATDSSTLVESWDGVAWTVVPSPSTRVQNNYLLSVSCTSAAACIAVGETAGSAGYDPLSEIWNGTAWTIVPTPGGDDLESVSCGAPRRCIAVGETDNTPIAVAWNGSEWRSTTVPQLGTQGTLHGVSCSRASSCTAVGYTNDNGIKTAFYQWDGSTWSAHEGVSPGLRTSNLYAVSCTRPASCVAVGPYVDGTHGGLAPWRGLSESWNGSTAKLLKTPQPGLPDRIAQLFAISCPATHVCVVVGSQSSHRESKTLALIGS